MNISLRPYQRAAFDEWRQYYPTHKSGLIIAPTGTGKTVLFSAIAEHYYNSSNRPILILAHRDELLNQAGRTIKEVTGLACGREQAGESLAGSLLLPPIVLGSIQSVSQPQRLERFDPDTFGLLITDECHHSAANGYKSVYAHFNPDFHLGVTATPDRLDGKALGAIFEDVIFEYEIREAI